MKINLVFASTPSRSGTTIFTVHLYKAMQMMGWHPQLFRLRNKTELNERKFGDWGLTYRNVEPGFIFKELKRTPTLLTHLGYLKNAPYDPATIPYMIKAGMRAVVHDNTDMKNYVQCGALSKLHRPIVIRPSRAVLLKSLHAQYIPHPYIRYFPPGNPPKHISERKLLAISLARVVSNKRTHLLLDANKLLPKAMRILIKGEDSRLYSWGLLSKYGGIGFRQGETTFERTFGAGAELAQHAKFLVDFTFIPDDGGGSQYTFMEAMDAATMVIVHQDWMRFKGEMKELVNCIAVDGTKGLVQLLKNEHLVDRPALIKGGYRLLDKHEPKGIAQLYLEELNR